jgi:hypothetical protein
VLIARVTDALGAVTSVAFSAVSVPQNIQETVADAAANILGDALGQDDITAALQSISILASDLNSDPSTASNDENQNNRLLLIDSLLHVSLEPHLSHQQVVSVLKTLEKSVVRPDYMVEESYEKAFEVVDMLSVAIQNMEPSVSVCFCRVFFFLFYVCIFS